MSTDDVRNPGERSIFCVGNYGEWPELALGESRSLYPNRAQAPGYLVYRLYPHVPGVRQLKHGVAWFIDDEDARVYAAYRNSQPPDGPFTLTASETTNV